MTSVCDIQPRGVPGGKIKQSDLLHSLDAIAQNKVRVVNALILAWIEYKMNVPFTVFSSHGCRS